LTIRSGLVDLGEKTFTWRHWIFNAKSGILLAEAEALVITLDLISRKSAAMPKEMFGSLEAILIDLN
jgi:acyl-CoA thioester hydrolase